MNIKPLTEGGEDMLKWISKIQEGQRRAEVKHHCQWVDRGKAAYEAGDPPLANPYGLTDGGSASVWWLTGWSIAYQRDNSKANNKGIS